MDRRSFNIKQKAFNITSVYSSIRFFPKIFTINHVFSEEKKAWFRWNRGIKNGRFREKEKIFLVPVTSSFNNAKCVIFSSLILNQFLHSPADVSSFPHLHFFYYLLRRPSPNLKGECFRSPTHALSLWRKSKFSFKYYGSAKKQGSGVLNLWWIFGFILEYPFRLFSGFSVST